MNKFMRDFWERIGNAMEGKGDFVEAVFSVSFVLCFCLMMIFAVFLVILLFHYIPSYLSMPFMVALPFGIVGWFYYKGGVIDGEDD